MTTQAILTLNGGSSSLKAALFASTSGQPLDRLCSVHISAIGGDSQCRLEIPSKQFDQHYGLDLPNGKAAYEAGLNHVQQCINEHFPDVIVGALGHRVVHGGNLTETTEIDAKTLAYLTELTPLAPLHQGANLALFSASTQCWPKATHLACCDTFFHASQPKIEQAYAIPDSWFQKGVRRYGFHGLSYGYIASQLEALGTLNQKTVVAHLGAGASLCALQHGKSVASTMGFTATDGIPMATRSGAIDPGVLLFLERHHQMSASDIETLLNKESGLLGLSGISGDIRKLHASQDPKAAFAIELFCYRIASEVARLSGAIEGLEQLVFTAGIGEHDAQVRAQVVNRCAWLGATLDEQRNNEGNAVISTESSPVTVRVIPTDEEAYMAAEVSAYLA